MRLFVVYAMIAIFGLGGVACGAAPDQVTLARDGRAQMKIIAPLSDDAHAPATELAHYLGRITGGTFEIITPAENATGIYVGTASDFPHLNLDAAEIKGLGHEGFILRSDGTNLLLISNKRAGAQHAVQTFLQTLGCRWFFPGEVWEIIPTSPTITGSWNETQTPAFPISREIWYGWGTYGPNSADKTAWDRHNRLGAIMPIHVNHAGHGMNESHFKEHPEWFALVRGKRIYGDKPCYSHPGYIEFATQRVLRQAAAGTKMISMTPADGHNYCECDLCRAWAKGGEVFWDTRTQFARRPDGVLVSITSESLFNCINEVAKALAKEYPDALVASYAYSSYAHPPSFKLEPNIFIQTTSAFRRTPMSLEDQLIALKNLGVQSGIYAYWSVYQWDWDYPDVRGEASLPRIIQDLRLYHQHNVKSFDSEMSNNWAARGLNYYLGVNVLWNADADISTLLDDFYDKAFGPAKEPMMRYYARWLGAWALPDADWDNLPPADKAGDESDNSRKPGNRTGTLSGLLDAVGVDDLNDVAAELGATGSQAFGVDSLRAAYGDLDEAAALVRNMPAYRARVDHIRMYAYYLFLRTRVDAAVARGDKDAIIAAIAEETAFGARLMRTNMLHVKPLVGNAFHRRFKAQMNYLKDLPESEKAEGFRAVRDDVPSREELEKLWSESKAVLGL